MQGKRLLAAKALTGLGVHRLVLPRRRDHIIILNYHRIREDHPSGAALFDQGVFGPSTRQFQRQMIWLKKTTRILSQRDFLSLLENGEGPGGPYSLVTFDDGYIDNYTLAMPVLSQLEIPAIMFAPTGAIEQRRLGWWDVIAYLVSKSPSPGFVFRGKTYGLAGGAQTVISDLQRMMKTEPASRTEGLLEELARACKTGLPSLEEQSRELMTWEQLRELPARNVSVGSHTRSHRVLTTLSEDEQEKELRLSKEELEDKLQRRCRCLAYPVGGPGCFSARTMELARQCGYEAAFAFGFLPRPLESLQPYALPRLEYPPDPGGFKAMISFPRLVTGLGPENKPIVPTGAAPPSPGLVRRLAARLWGYHRRMVYHLPLQGLEPPVADKEVVYRLGRPEDLEELDIKQHDYDPEAKQYALRRLEAGDLWLVGHKGKEVVFYCWVSLGAIETGLDWFLTAPPGVGCVYKVFTVEDQRGQGLYPACYPYLAPLLISQGVRDLLTLVADNNLASRRSAEKAGYRPAGWLGTWHFMGRKRHRWSRGAMRLLKSLA